MKLGLQKLNYALFALYTASLFLFLLLLGLNLLNDALQDAFDLREPAR